METEPLPCPFCGGETEATNEGAEDAPVPWMVRHVGPTRGWCPITGGAHRRTKDEAIQVWNHRTPPTEDREAYRRGWRDAMNQRNVPKSGMDRGRKKAATPPSPEGESER